MPRISMPTMRVYATSTALTVKMPTTKRGRKQKTPRRWDEYARWPDYDHTDDEADITESHTKETALPGTLPFVLKPLFF